MQEYVYNKGIFTKKKVSQEEIIFLEECPWVHFIKSNGGYIKTNVWDNKLLALVLPLMKKKNKIKLKQIQNNKVFYERMNQWLLYYPSIRKKMK